METNLETKECNCINDVTSQIRERTQQIFSKDEDISDIDVALDLGCTIDKDKLTTTTITNVTISYLLKGKWKKKKSAIAHSYCPFCGKKK
jgi:hypothetical protein